MRYDTIMLKKEDKIATIIFNRPEKMNAVTPQMIEEILKVIAELSGDEGIKVVILTGAGRGFCAGSDLEHPVFTMQDPELIKRAVEDFGRLSLGLRSMPKPVIASVNGPAVGAGCNFALACDIIIASEGARFGQAFVNIGLHPDSGGSYFLPRLVGIAKACELIFTGKIIDAREAEKIGLVNQVVPASLLEAKTRELALQLAQGPTLALGLAKTSLYQGLEMNLYQVLEMEAKAQTLCILSGDVIEGIKAFREKRKPDFK